MRLGKRKRWVGIRENKELDWIGGEGWRRPWVD